MSSLWELSTDTVVTTLIVVGISVLALAWLFAGRRRPQSQRSALEQRRLAGREAEVSVTPAPPPLMAAVPEEEPSPIAPPSASASIAESVPEPAAPQHMAEPTPAAKAPEPVAEAEVEPPLQVEPSGKTAQPSATEQPAESTLVLKPSAAVPPPAPSPKPAAKPVAKPAPRSAEQASAMSIAAALVRHDKREAPSSKPAEEAMHPEPARCTDGDDLTAIDGIDQKLAKEMNDLGVRYYEQISDWAPDYAAWITSRLSTSVTSDQRNAWIAEAKALADQPPATGPSRASQGR